MYVYIIYIYIYIFIYIFIFIYYVYTRLAMLNAYGIEIFSEIVNHFCDMETVKINSVTSIHNIIIIHTANIISTHKTNLNKIKPK